jgi:hypothetical protein
MNLLQINYDPTARGKFKRKLLDLPEDTAESKKVAYVRTRNSIAAEQDQIIFRGLKLPGKGSNPFVQTELGELLQQNQLLGYVEKPILNTRDLNERQWDRNKTIFSGTGGDIRNLLSEAGQQVPWKFFHPEMNMAGGTLRPEARKTAENHSGLLELFGGSDQKYVDEHGKKLSNKQVLDKYNKINQGVPEGHGTMMYPFNTNLPSWNPLSLGFLQNLFGKGGKIDMNTRLTARSIFALNNTHGENVRDVEALGVARYAMNKTIGATTQNASFREEVLAPDAPTIHREIVHPLNMGGDINGDRYVQMADQPGRNEHPLDGTIRDEEDNDSFTSFDAAMHHTDVMPGSSMRATAPKRGGLNDSFSSSRSSRQVNSDVSNLRTPGDVFDMNQTDDNRRITNNLYGNNIPGSFNFDSVENEIMQAFAAERGSLKGPSVAQTGTGRTTMTTQQMRSDAIGPVATDSLNNAMSSLNPVIYDDFEERMQKREREEREYEAQRDAQPKVDLFDMSAFHEQRRKLDRETNRMDKIMGRKPTVNESFYSRQDVSSTANASGLGGGGAKGKSNKELRAEKEADWLNWLNTHNSLANNAPAENVYITPEGGDPMNALRQHSEASIIKNPRGESKSTSKKSTVRHQTPGGTITSEVHRNTAINTTPYSAGGYFNQPRNYPSLSPLKFKNSESSTEAGLSFQGQSFRHESPSLTPQHRMRSGNIRTDSTVRRRL